MKFFAAATALLATSVSALPTLVDRDLASISKAITNVQNSITTLNNSVNAFQPTSLNTLTQAFAVYNNTNTLGTNINKATRAANQSAVLNEDDSFTLGDQVLALEPMVQSLLANLQAKKPTFDKVLFTFSLRKTVLNELVLQKQLTAQLGTAIVKKIDPDFATIGNNVNSDIAGFFASAIKTYSVPGKDIELPSLPVGVLPDGITVY